MLVYVITGSASRCTQHTPHHPFPFFSGGVCQYHGGISPGCWIPFWERASVERSTWWTCATVSRAGTLRLTRSFPFINAFPQDLLLCHSAASSSLWNHIRVDQHFQDVDTLIIHAADHVNVSRITFYAEKEPFHRHWIDWYFTTWPRPPSPHVQWKGTTKRAGLLISHWTTRPRDQLGLRGPVRTTLLSWVWRRGRVSGTWPSSVWLVSPVLVVPKLFPVLLWLMLCCWSVVLYLIKNYVYTYISKGHGSISISSYVPRPKELITFPKQQHR